MGELSDGGDELCFGKWFDEYMIHLGILARFHFFGECISCDGHDRTAHIAASEHACRLYAAHDRHVDIHQNNVIRMSHR